MLCTDLRPNTIQIFHHDWDRAVLFLSPDIGRSHMHNSFTHLVFGLTMFLKVTRFSTIRAHGPSLWACERSTQVLVAAMQESIIACEENGLHKASTVDKYKSLYHTQLPHQQHYLPIPIHYPSLLSSPTEQQPYLNYLDKMCDFTEIQYICQHTRRVLTGWYPRYQESHVRCQFENNTARITKIEGRLAEYCPDWHYFVYP